MKYSFKKSLVGKCVTIFINLWKLYIKHIKMCVVLLAGMSDTNQNQTFLKMKIAMIEKSCDILFNKINGLILP